jgi:hypothetical protein
MTRRARIRGLLKRSGGRLAVIAASGRWPRPVARRLAQTTRLPVACASARPIVRIDGLLDYIHTRADEIGLRWPPSNTDVIDVIESLNLRRGLGAYDEFRDDYADRGDQPADGYQILTLAITLRALDRPPPLPAYTEYELLQRIGALTNPGPDIEPLGRPHG